MKKYIIAICSALLSVFLSVLSVLVVSAETEAPVNLYDEYVAEFMSQYTYVNKVTGEVCVHEYEAEVAYEHFENDAQTPEYVVLFLYCNGNGDTLCYEIGGYYLYGHDNQYNGRPAYLVFDTDAKEVLWIDEALEKDSDKYFAFFSESGYKNIIRIGDVNRDNKLNINDATEIQKFIAGINVSFSEFDDEILGFANKMNGKWGRYISDFNRDGVRNIKDATAIQKHIAGLEY